MTHTPTWRVEVYKTAQVWSYQIVGCGDVCPNARIAEINPYLKDAGEKAAHIVKCVNSHDELVSCLKELVKPADRDDVNDTWSDEFKRAEEILKKAI